MTRHRLAWADLAGARVGVWGLGVEGRASVARLELLGADVVRVDDDPAGDDGSVLASSAGGLEALRGCDAVVKAPGISRHRGDVAALEAAGVPVVGGLGLWLHGAPLERVVCVTGTKGKSTTASLLGHLLRGVGHRVLVGGNLGIPPWAPTAPGPDDVDRWVIEVSSYQATDVAVSPPLVAVTSLHPDHLPWHGGLDRYYPDKLSLCTQPGADLTVAADVPELRDRRALLGPRVEWVGAAGSWADGFGLLGVHNRRNAEIARACLRALGEPVAGDDGALAALAAGFEPLPSRLRLVGAVDGVDFADDSLSTNVLPTIAAVDAFGGRRVALLLGGHDRGIDYAPLARHLAARTEPTLVLTLPDNGPRIADALAAAGVESTAAAGVPEATEAAFAWARPDGVVLLSPAAPSFGQYRDYRDRSEAFRARLEDITAAAQRTGSSGA